MEVPASRIVHECEPRLNQKFSEQGVTPPPIEPLGTCSGQTDEAARVTGTRPTPKGGVICSPKAATTTSTYDPLVGPVSPAEWLSLKQTNLSNLISPMSEAFGRK